LHFSLLKKVISILYKYNFKHKSANYRIEFSEISCCVKTKQKHCCRFKKVNFIQDTFNDIKYDWIKQDCYTFKKTNKKASINDKNIVILHIQNKK